MLFEGVPELSSGFLPWRQFLRESIWADKMILS